MEQELRELLLQNYNYLNKEAKKIDFIVSDEPIYNMVNIKLCVAIEELLGEKLADWKNWLIENERK